MDLAKLARLVRYYILVSSTAAASGHPTSSLSAADLMVTLLFGNFFRFDLKNIKNPNNDRLIFSKGHGSPLFYALYAAAGVLSEKELMQYRKINSNLEGHPSMRFPYTEAATGSLGQGLSIGVGMAINAKYLDKLLYKTYVLLGDSEMAEGSVWEAIQLAAYYKLDNLVAILDVNRLGQRGQTMYGHDIKAFEKRISSFGWETICVDGHNMKDIKQAFEKAQRAKNQPVMIIAKTIKGKGVSFLEDQDGWHGKALSPEELEKALLELGEIDKKIQGKIEKPKKVTLKKIRAKSVSVALPYKIGDMVATRRAYGNALPRLYPKFPDMVVLDAETSNSTYAQSFQKAYPERFFEMFIAEQNMLGVALGLSARNKIPFVSTFAAFLSRAYDQVRMSQYSNANLKIVGSHAGVSIGEDGPSQMALEDLASFRSIMDSVVLYPSDAVSTERLVEIMAQKQGIIYLRTTRKETPVIYSKKDKFVIGGSKVLRQSDKDKVTVVGAGVTLFESLEAYDILQKEGINIRVVDLYSIKPIDIKTLEKCARETKAIITVEDHHLEGGLGEAVSSALSAFGAKIYFLAVLKKPKSATPAQLLDYEDISKDAIVKKVKEILHGK